MKHTHFERPRKWSTHANLRAKLLWDLLILHAFRGGADTFSCPVSVGNACACMRVHACATVCVLVYSVPHARTHTCEIGVNAFNIPHEFDEVFWCVCVCVCVDRSLIIRVAERAPRTPWRNIYLYMYIPDVASVVAHTHTH